MRGKFILLSIILVATLAVPATFAGVLGARNYQDDNSNKRKLGVPQRGRRRHRDRRHTSVGRHYKNAGKSAGHGGKGFGKDIAHGKPVKGGKELGKGMGEFGKDVGKGTGQAGKKVGKTVKHAVTP